MEGKLCYPCRENSRRELSLSSFGREPPRASQNTVKSLRQFIINSTKFACIVIVNKEKL